MSDSPILFTDAQMRQFISKGFVVVKSSLPREAHDAIYQKLLAVYEKEGNPGNNILPRVPDIQDVFDDPVIKGAFTSVLGPDNIMHPHRHGHFNPPSSRGGGWHKDSYWGYGKVRHHHPRWAMAFYYPQDVPMEVGPTGVIPGTQFYANRFENQDDEGIPLIGEAGTVAIIHYDLWHRANPNVTEDVKRFMLKFQFVRMEEPTEPSWNCENREWQPLENHGLPRDHSPIWRNVWNWLAGNDPAPRPADAKMDELAAALTDESESVGLNAAYSLAEYGSVGVPALIEGLKTESETTRRNAAYGLSAAGVEAIPALIDALSDEVEGVRSNAAYALGEIGPDATEAAEALVKALEDSAESVRRHASESLGLVKEPTALVVPALSRALKDTDDQVRFNASLSLTRIGERAAPSIPALVESLEDPNRYVRGYSTEALHRIGTREANTALFRYLQTSRWCYNTTRESTF
ncbi:MAG: HEAT repeat domain-containing protein [Candidatus Poribacteria bacterium]|nr:HEAT repeat domain-containing protein [Candidatus Poribacteria bacterium]